MTTDFQRDDKWQRGVRDLVLRPLYYDVHWNGHIPIDSGRLASYLQKKFSVDSLIEGFSGRTYFVEEKIVRPPREGEYTAYALETDSCTVPGKEAEGWMRYGRADLLLYAFVRQDRSVDVHMIDFPRLQDWFVANEGRLDEFGPLKTGNASAGRKAPCDEVKAAGIPVWIRQVLPNLDDPAVAELFNFPSDPLQQAPPRGGVGYQDGRGVPLFADSRPGHSSELPQSGIA